MTSSPAFPPQILCRNPSCVKTRRPKGQDIGRSQCQHCRELCCLSCDCLASLLRMESAEGPLLPPIEAKARLPRASAFVLTGVCRPLYPSHCSLMYCPHIVFPSDGTELSTLHINCVCFHNHDPNPSRAV